MDHIIMKKAIIILAVSQIVNGNPIHNPHLVNVNPRNVDPVSAINAGDNIPQHALVILVAGPCKPELTAEAKTDGFVTTPLGVVPVNLEQLILRNQVINALNQQSPQDDSLNVEKASDLLNGGLLSSGSIASALGIGGVTSESGSNLFQGGLLGGGSLGSGLLGNLGSAPTSGSGLLLLLPLGSLSELNLGNLGNGTLLGLLNLTPGSTNTNLITALLANLGSGTTGTGQFGSHLQSVWNHLMNKPNLLTILGSLALGNKIPTMSNTGGLAGILGSLGIGGGIPAGPAGGLAGLLANLGITNTIGTTPVFGATTSGVLGFLNSLHPGGKLKGNFRRYYYSRNVDQKEEIDEMPWLVTILVDGIPVADGVLISDQHVLTVADPLFKVKSDNIVILRQEDRCSKSNALNMTVKEIIRNPLYDVSTKAHDLTILKLSNRLPVSPQLLPVCLPALYTPYIVYEATVASYYAGPADVGPSCKPRQVTLPVQLSETCASSIKPPTLVTEDKTCLGVQGAKEVMCGAAPGTAVQHRAGDGTFELIGIMTHSRVCGTSASTLFVRVHDHLPWILENTQDSKLCMKI